jgi:hypothetical protein
MYPLQIKEETIVIILLQHYFGYTIFHQIKISLNFWYNSWSMFFSVIVTNSLGSPIQVFVYYFKGQFVLSMGIFIKSFMEGLKVICSLIGKYLLSTYCVVGNVFVFPEKLSNCSKNPKNRHLCSNYCIRNLSWNNHRCTYRFTYLDVHCCMKSKRMDMA